MIPPIHTRPITFVFRIYMHHKFDIPSNYIQCSEALMYEKILYQGNQYLESTIPLHRPM